MGLINGLVHFNLLKRIKRSLSYDLRNHGSDPVTLRTVLALVIFLAEVLCVQCPAITPAREEAK